jgi:hypothetical protein
MEALVELHHERQLPFCDTDGSSAMKPGKVNNLNELPNDEM